LQQGTLWASKGCFFTPFCWPFFFSFFFPPFFFSSNLIVFKQGFHSPISIEQKKESATIIFSNKAKWFLNQELCSTLKFIERFFHEIFDKRGLKKGEEGGKFSWKESRSKQTLTFFIAIEKSPTIPSFLTLYFFISLFLVSSFLLNL